MTRNLLLFLLTFAFLHADGEKNDYYNELTPRDKENLSFMIETLSSHSAPALLAYKRELEQRGMETDHVHALQRLGYIFSDPKLAAATKNIGKVPWRRFARDFGKSLAKADQDGDLPPQVVEDFSRQIGADPKVIGTYVENKKWVELMNYLRDR